MALSPGQVLNHQRVLRIPRLNMMKKRIGTWNTRTLFESGKLDNAIQEMTRLRLDILGVSETRWPGSGICQKNGAVFYYAGNDDPNHRNGVGFILTDEMNKSVRNVVACSDRIMLLQLSARPEN